MLTIVVYQKQKGKTPECVRECVRGSRRDWRRDRFYGATSESFVGEEAMQVEIMKNGPIEGMMLVFEDLYAYHTGIYKHVKGGIAGAHAVKIIGWGVENRFVLFPFSLSSVCFSLSHEFHLFFFFFFSLNSTKFWTVANSWGRDWGEEGFFRIVRGAQECAIETDSFAGLPRPVV